MKMNTKFCSKCREEKHLSEFYKQKEGMYGVRSECKKCKIASSNEYRNKNIEKILLNGRQNYQANRENILEERKKRYQEDDVYRERARERAKKREKPKQ